MNIAKFKYCKLMNTPREFDLDKFLKGDVEQLNIYKNSKRPDRHTSISHEDIIKKPDMNYARIVPKGCMFIDFDNIADADNMLKIIVKSKVSCRVLETVNGYHFLFRTPTFYKKELTKATNWFGYEFDTKGENSVQIMKVCGMNRKDYLLSKGVAIDSPSDSIDIDELDILPYWLWGKLKNTDLHKKGKPGESEYTLLNTPFTQLMTLTEGSRHNHIVEKCSYFGVSNGFYIDEFKSLVQAIHDNYMVHIGSPMSDADLFGDLDPRWSEYIATLSSSAWEFDEKLRIWNKIKRKKEEAMTEREASLYLFANSFNYFVKENNSKLSTGVELGEGLFYMVEDDYECKKNLSPVRQILREYSSQNFKISFFEEVEKQIMQLCRENNKILRRSYDYVIAKNKLLFCGLDRAINFKEYEDIIATDIVYSWTYETSSWVKEHESEEGRLISKFIKELSRNSIGEPDPVVEQWLYIVAGAAMIPGDKLEKIVVLAGGGANGKSLYTSLIRLCLGEDLFNLAKIFDSSPQDGFWGETLDKGICCIVDDMPRLYNKDAFSYIKGAITGTDSVQINEKFKPRKEIMVLPTIISCTNHPFELYDKSEGMRRRVLILPTECEVPELARDKDLQIKMILGTDDKEQIAKYRMGTTRHIGEQGSRIINVCFREKCVMDSLNGGSLAWFANKARHTYFKWLTGELILTSSLGMIEKSSGTFKGGFDVELYEFLTWFLTGRTEGRWMRGLYDVFADWHNEVYSGEILMKEHVFNRNITKAVQRCKKDGFKIEMKKKINDKRMSLNYLFVDGR